MEKIKVTKKFINDNFKNVICSDYCGLYNLLKCKNAKYYTSGVYGWNADIYIINQDTCIVTGYRPFGNIENYKIVRKYNNIAYEKKLNNLFKNIDDELEKLTNEFVNEILKGE